MIFTDAAEVSQRRRTKDGYMVVDAHVARVGVQHYLGAEVGKPEMAMIAVYRPEEEVFSADAINSYAHRPVTIGHPPQGVTAANWRDVARGSVGGDIVRDGGRVRVPMVIMDQGAIAEVEAGTREISMGYHCRLEFTDGVTPQGEPYQAIQRDLRMNHAAIVPKGRAGSECRIGDSWADFDTAGAREPGNPVQRDTSREKVSMKTLTIDGHPVELSDAAVIAVSNLQKQLGTAVADALAKDTALQTALSDHAKAISTKDAALADAVKAGETKDGEIAALKKQLEDAKLTPQKLDEAVAARGKVIADAKRIAGDKLVTDGKTEAEIRREAVSVHLGDAAKALSDEAVNGAFLSYASKAPTTDHLGRTISASVPSPGQIVGDSSAAAYDEMCRSYDAAWKRPIEGNA